MCCEYFSHYLFHFLFAHIITFSSPCLTLPLQDARSYDETGDQNAPDGMLPVWQCALRPNQSIANIDLDIRGVSVMCEWGGVEHIIGLCASR